MAVRETQLTPEQKSQEIATQEQDERSFASKLANSMDLPSTLAGEVDAHVKEANAEPKEVEEEVEETEEPEVPADEIDDAGKDSEESEGKDEDEELIPKSKVQKRFDELTSQLKKLQAEVERTRSDKPDSPKDSDEAQLEKMTEAELKTLKRQVRVEQIKNSADEAKVAQLMDLEEKIENTIRTAPARFQSSQIENFNKAVAETAETLEGFDKVKTEIFNHAKAIYDSAPELHSSPRGQERAWRFAVDHFKALNKVSEGKSSKSELERQVNTLKKKISVDTSTKKGVQQPDSDAALKRKAIYGTDADKARFLKTRINTNSLVSDDVLEGLGQNRR